MQDHHLTRREAIRTAAAAALPLVAAGSAAAGPPPVARQATTVPAQSPPPEPVPPPRLSVGVATLGFGTYTNRQLAEELAGEGIHTVQLFLNQTDSRYWKYNGRSDLTDLTEKRCKAIADDYRASGVKIHSMGVYTNLIHPDEAERKANLEYFEGMMRAAVAMGVSTLITEAGHYQPEGPCPRVEYHFQEEVWGQMVATGEQLAALANRHKVTVLLEPFFRGFLASAKRTRLFIEEVGSPRIRALLDPANLLEVNDLEEMFGQLTPQIDCLHAKDRKLHVDRGVPAGQGDLDYPTFVRLAAQRTPKMPLILEYVGPNDYKQALAHLQGAMKEAGLQWQ